MKRLTGLVACLGIVAVVAGVPVVLLHIGANPLPSGLGWADVWARLVAPDDGTLVRALFSLLAWAAWIYFTIAILVEIVSRARRIRAPRLPGFSPSQMAARSLVGAAVLLFTAAPLAAHAQPATPAPTAHATTAHTTHAQLSSRPGNASPTQAGARGSVTTHPKKDTKTHTVHRGESLSSIAQHELGDQHRWPEIAELNYGRTQADGHALTHEHVIQPGWKLRLPTTNDTPGTAHTYRVHRGDTLWSIADDNLGSGDRYPEILRASRTIEQPGGVRITDPDDIDTGWVVRIPGQKTHHADPKPHNGKSNDRPHPKTTPQASPPDRPTPSATPAPTSSAPAPTPTNTAPPAPSTENSRSSSSTEEDGLNAVLPVATAAGVGTLLAAGVISLVTYRRRQQQRRRRPGRRVPMPAGDAAHTEQQLRATADPLSVNTVDAALRGLARSCAETGQPLPPVRAARLTGEQFDLYLDEPATLPDPWTGTVDATVWTLLADSADQVDTDLAGVPAPYPALVTIGHDLDDGHVFLDLEYLTSLGLTGSPELATQVLAALAIELATSRWADDLQVTIVGAYPELEDALQTGRIRYLPSVGRVLDDLAARAADDRAALSDADVPDLNHARTSRQAPDAWTPEIVLIAGQLTERQHTQLDQLADAMPRVAIATVTSGGAVGDWELILDDTADTAVLEPIGLTLRPQRIDPDTYAQILEVVATATDDQDAPDNFFRDDPSDVISTADVSDDDTAPHDISEPSADELAAAEAQPGVESSDPVDDHAPPTDTPSAELRESAEHLNSDAEAGQLDSADPSGVGSMPSDELDADNTAVRVIPARKPRICVLGPVTIENAAGTVEPSKKARLLEYGAYLALNPNATLASVDDAIWPSRTTEDNLNTRNTATSKLRAWVGRNPSGEPYLPRHRYTFCSDVTTDWDQWRQLIGPDPAKTPTTHLEQALSLVRGRPFEGTQLRRYAWAEPLKQEMISAIADVAYELAHRRLMDGRWRAADEAAARAVSIEPGLERLWRVRILAAHEAHNAAAESEAIDRMLLTIDELGFDLEPETTQLLAALQDPKCNFDQLKEAL